MKTKLTILAMVLCLAGCSRNVDTPEAIAEKYLNELSSDLSELGFYNAHEHDSRSAALIYNEQADSIISGGAIPTYPELSKKYFQDDKHFYRWEAMDVKADMIDVYKVWDFTDMTETEKEVRLNLLDKKPIKQTDFAAVIPEFQNVPMYILRYKIDKTHTEFVGDNFLTTEIRVIKHPEYGYKVASFTWEE